MSDKQTGALGPALERLEIVQARSYLLEVPVPVLRIDSQSDIAAWNVLAVELVSRSGIHGWGYQCGFGPVMRATRVLLDQGILPRLVGLDARSHRTWWRQVQMERHHLGLSGPAMQGVSAPEVAAWDMMSKAAGLPLWALLGGRVRDRVPCYNTNVGWLGFTRQELLDNVHAAVDAGFVGVKIKIGLDDFGDDMSRLEIVRASVGDDLLIAVDVNNRWDLHKALVCAPYLIDVDSAWLEEPLHPFDVAGHAELAAAIETPLLHGENIYDPLMFRDMLNAGALDIPQPSEMKLGGISRWLEVATMARIAGRRIVPAGWTMMQTDQHLAAVTPHCWMIEYIPWILDIFEEPARFEDGVIVVPDTPGASTTIKQEALERYAVR